jgi:glycosyltransferase involved in cell wall biosynthesis
LQIKVLHIIDSLRPGGAETIAINTFNALNKQHNVDAYLCATRIEGSLKRYIEKQNNYLFLNKNKRLDIPAFMRLYSFIKENDIKIIHAHAGLYYLAVLIKIRFSNIKLVWHNHTGANVNLSGKKKIFLKLNAFFINTIINVNEDLNKWNKNNLTVKHNVVINNFALFINNEKQTKLKGSNTHKIVCVAGLRPEKDHLNLLNAFLKLKEINNNCSLHIIGKEYNDAYSKSIKAFIKSNILDKQVFLYNDCLDIKYILSQANIGVLSSKTEGLPLALLEYGLAKLPVIVTNVGDCSKIVKHQINGIIVNKENSEELANGLSFIVQNELLAKQFGNKLEQDVLKNYSLENYIDKLVNLYSNI